MRFDDLVDRDVVIWGTGREGRAAHAELARRGIDASFALTDSSAAPSDLAQVATGEAAIDRLCAADVVIKSPGVPHTSPVYRRLLDGGVTIASLTDMWLTADPSRVVGVTGTKGKSTTSSVIHHLLNEIGISAALVGNGGTPVTDGDSGAAEVAVTEVSSYQAAELTVSPRIAVVTSLYPEHLPWHGSYEQYVFDKLNLVAHQPQLVVTASPVGEIADLVRARIDGRTRLAHPADIGITANAGGVVWTDVGEISAAAIQLQGQHNFVNLTLALTAVTLGFDVAPSLRGELLAAAAAFAPLSHRLEPVHSCDGRRWIDDSLATAPQAVIAALETVADARVSLILGGADRGLDFAPLVQYLVQRGDDVEVVALGPAGRRWCDEGGPRAFRTDSFDEAMGFIRADPTRTDVVLLSPGAPSFDAFANYEQRSAAFVAAAQLTCHQ